MYFGEDNALLLLVSNTDPKNIEIKLTNGDLISFQNGICIVRPLNFETVILEVWLRSENIILIKKEYKVINRS